MKIFCEKNLFLITINIETGFIKIQTLKWILLVYFQQYLVLGSKLKSNINIAIQSDTVLGNVRNWCYIWPWNVVRFP